MFFHHKQSSSESVSTDLAGAVHVNLPEASWTPRPEAYEIGRPLPSEIVRKVFADSQCMAALEEECHIPTNVLELGSGNGRVLLPLAQAYRGKGWQFMGVDRSPNMLEVCAARAQKQGLENVHLKEGDIFRVWPSHSFHLVVHSSVLHAIPDWKTALITYTRALKSGGHFVLFGDYGDLYAGLLGRRTPWGCDPTLTAFWRAYREARAEVNAPMDERCQTGCKWDLYSTEIAKEFRRFGLKEVEQTRVEWEERFPAQRLMQIVLERCYSSMFSLGEATFQDLLRKLNQKLDGWDFEKPVVSRHQAVARFFLAPWGPPGWRRGQVPIKRSFFPWK